MSSVTRTYFMLNVADMARAVAFYREVLGPVIRYESEQWSELKLGDATVALHAGSGKPRETGLAVEVAELDVACEAVTRMGGTVLVAPQHGAGTRSAEVADTEGNSFTLVAG
ncbi:MAG: VOC family protein [Acidimicrobiia bacterium]|nr:VOC family protein [Acidimicrobiia bacterium]